MPHPDIIASLNATLDDIETVKRRLVAETRAMTGVPLPTLAVRFAEVRALHARLKAITTGLNQLAEHLSYDLVPVAMERAGSTAIILTGFGRVGLSTRVSASIVDKQGAFDWLRANHKGDLIIETVNGQTLGATARELIEAGGELPEPYFKTTVRTYTRLTAPGEKRKRDHDEEIDDAAE